MSSRPPIGVEVVLERGGDSWFAARVSSYDGDRVVLTLDDAEEAPASVSEAVMSWTTERGVFRAPGSVTLEGTRARVALHAAATRTQRREYVRLPMDTQMTLAHSNGVARGTLIDLSEAALRMRMPDTGKAVIEPGDEVRSAFTIHHTGFMLRGTVLREQASGVPNTIDVVVMLDIPARTANDLRRNVVFEQIERQSDLYGAPTDEPRRDLR